MLYNKQYRLSESESHLGHDLKTLNIIYAYILASSHLSKFFDAI